MVIEFQNGNIIAEGGPAQLPREKSRVDLLKDALTDPAMPYKSGVWAEQPPDSAIKTVTIKVMPEVKDEFIPVLDLLKHRIGELV